MPTALDKIAEAVKSCRACPLRRSCKTPLPGRGGEQPQIVIVTDKITTMDNREGAVGAGSEMQLMFKALARAGINPSDVYLTSIVKCFAGSYRRKVKTPPATSVTACEPFLEAELTTIKPKLTIAIGDKVMRWFGITGGVRQNSGRIFDTQWGSVLVMLHPGSFTDKSKMRDVWQFFTQANSIITHLDGGSQPPEFGDTDEWAKIVGLDVEAEMLDEGMPLWSIGLADAGNRFAYKYEGQEVDLSGYTPVLHNAKYDVAKLAEAGIEVDDWWDTIVEAHLLGHQPLALKSLAPVFLGIHADKFKDIVGTGKKQKRLDDVPLMDVLDYNAMDAWMSYELHKIFYPQIKAKGWEKFLKSEKEVTKTLISMERTGLPVSQAKLKVLNTELLKQMVRAENKLAEIGLTPDSKDEFAQWFWRRKGRVQTTKTGKPTTKGAVLRDEASEEQAPYVEAFLEWHQARTFRSTYVGGWEGKEWVHPSLNQTGTATWRFSCSNPNLQNVPKTKDENQQYNLGAMLHQVFVAPEGYTFISCDYSQIELRIMAVLNHLMTGNDSMLKVYAAGGDLHSETQQIEEVYLAAERLRQDARRFAKIINFGIAYGMTAHGMAPKLQVPEHVAQDMIDGFYNRFVGFREMQDEFKYQAQRYGYVETFEGRPLWVPGMAATWGSIRGHAENEAINFPIQGGALEIIKDKMNECRQYLVMQVHDELLYLVPESEAEEYGKHLKTTLVDNRHPIPYPTDFHVGRTWGDIKSIPDFDYTEVDDDD